MTEAITHLVIARACDADPEGPNAEARLGLVKEPTAEQLRDFDSQIVQMYLASFHRSPERVGVVVLPWVGELDDPDADPA